MCLARHIRPEYLKKNDSPQSVRVTQSQIIPLGRVAESHFPAQACGIASEAIFCCIDFEGECQNFLRVWLSTIVIRMPS